MIYIYNQLKYQVSKKKIQSIYSAINNLITKSLENINKDVPDAVQIAKNRNSLQETVLLFNQVYNEAIREEGKINKDLYDVRKGRAAL